MRCFKAGLLIFVMIVIGCSGSGDDPISPDTNKNVNFFPDAIEVFGPETDEVNFTNLFHDVSLAQIGRLDNGNPGSEWGTNHGCFAVSLNRFDNDPAHPFKPVFRWLDSEDYDIDAVDNPMSYVCERDAINPFGETAEYRAVACDAAFNPDGSWLLNIEENSIEVVVAYMARNRSDVPNDDNWDIEVTALQWTGNDRFDFWEKPPTHRIIRVLPGAAIDGFDQYNPDIAYDFELGAVYLTYTGQVDEDGNFQHLRYRHYERVTNAVSVEYNAQTTYPKHNGYDPSIDVGRITVGGNTNTWIAIGYTAQYDQGHIGYHVNVTAWPRYAGDSDKWTSMRLQNPDH